MRNQSKGAWSGTDAGRPAAHRQRPRLLPPQSLDRVEARRAAGGEIAEHDPDQGRKAERDHDDRRSSRNGTPRRAVPSPAKASPPRTPMSPPNSDSITASTRNCSRTWPSTAPIARRMPISRVRSVTETSMMFMMPMPPTSRLTAATAPRRPVSTVVAPAAACTICRMSRTVKSSSSPREMLRRSRNKRSMSACTFAVSTPSRAET